MRAIKVMATVDQYGQLALDRPLPTDQHQRVEVIILIPEDREPNEDEEALEEEGRSKAALLEDFRQAWHEAKTGQTIPVAQLWEGLEDG